MSTINEIQKQKQRMAMSYQKEIDKLKNEIFELKKENRILNANGKGFPLWSVIAYFG